MKVTRRQVIGLGAGMVAAGWALSRHGTGKEIHEPTGPVIDFHAHLFGAGDGGTGCYLSSKQKKHVTYAFFLKLLGLEENGRFDQEYLDRIVGLLRESSLDRAVAEDCRYDSLGRPDMENEREDVLERTVYGSDTPFPSNALVFWNRLPAGKLFHLATEKNLFERDYRLKQALGLPPHVFERGARLLGLA